MEVKAEASSLLISEASFPFPPSVNLKQLSNDTMNFFLVNRY